MTTDKSTDESILISVIIPMYNAEKTIEKCIESVAASTCKELEIIVVDDGSLDQSSQKVTNLKKGNDRLTYFRQCNSGVSAARNKGIELASGDFIAFCDSDDYVKNSYIEEMLKSQRKYDSDWVISGYRKSIGKKSFVFDKPYSLSYISEDQSDEFLKDWYKNQYIAGPWGKLYRSEIIKSNGIYFPVNMNHGEDTVFNIRYYQYCASVSIVSKALYYYVDNCQSLTSQNRTDIWENQQQLFHSFQKMSKQKCSKVQICQLFYIRGILLALNHAQVNKWKNTNWKELCRKIRNDEYFSKLNIKKLNLDRFAYIVLFLLKNNRLFALKLVYRLKLWGYQHLKKIYYSWKR